jgi:hypothetical protein
VDESTRKQERSLDEGGPEAVARLARTYLRQGRADDALELTEGASAPEVLAVRAELLHEVGELEDAVEAAGAARRADAGAVGDDLRARLRDALLASTPEARDDDLVDLAQARRLALLADEGDLADVRRRVSGLISTHGAALARAQVASGAAGAALLADDPSPLVRALAQGTHGTPPYADEPTPTRLFSAHGPDFKSGTFVAFETSCEDRLTYFSTDLFRAVNDLLGVLRNEVELAFGRGYGLAMERGQAAGYLEARVGEINAAGVLPFPLVVHHHQPFDVLVGVDGGGSLSPEDERLAGRFAEDLARHPARMNNPGDTAPYARILGAFRGGNPEPDALEALFREAEQVYGPVGVSALRRFARRAGQENDALAARRARRGR